MNNLYLTKLVRESIDTLLEASRDYTGIRKTIAKEFPEKGTYERRHTYTPDDRKRYASERRPKILKAFRNLFASDLTAFNQRQKIKPIESLEVFSAWSKNLTNSTIGVFVEHIEDTYSSDSDRMIGKFFEYFKEPSDATAAEAYQVLYEKEPQLVQLQGEDEKKSASRSSFWPALVQSEAGKRGRKGGQEVDGRAIGSTQRMFNHINSGCCVAYKMSKAGIKVDEEESKRKFIEYFQSNKDFRTEILAHFTKFESKYPNYFDSDLITAVIVDRNNDEKVGNLYETLDTLSGTQEGGNRLFPAFDTDALRREFLRAQGGAAAAKGTQSLGMDQAMGFNMAKVVENSSKTEIFFKKLYSTFAEKVDEPEYADKAADLQIAMQTLIELEPLMKTLTETLDRLKG